MCEELNTVTCKGSILTLDSRNDGENVRSKVGKPEGNAALWKFSIHGVGDGSRQLANGYRMFTSDIIALSYSLWSLCAQKKCRGHVINVNRVQKSFPTINDTEQALLD